MTLPIAIDYRPALLSRAGIGRVTRELARALAERTDLEVHLFGHSLAAARVPTAIPEGARLHRWPLPGRSLGTLARLGLGGDRLAGNVGIFHWTDFVQPPAGRAAKVLTVHDLAFVRQPQWHGAAAATLSARTRIAIAAADVVVVPSRTTAADVREFAPAADVRVVPFGCDHTVAATNAAHPLDGRPYALCLGTIEPRKNHRTLLQAWRALPAPRPLLVVIGGIGWECGEIVAELRRAERDGIVQWLQDCDDAAMWRWLGHAMLLVYPSLWEGFGLPPLEAMHCGVPVIAHDTPVLRETTAGAARLVDATDAENLAAAVREVTTDADLRAGLIALGRDRAAAFRWQHCAEHHAAIYHEVAR
ncbi:MAG: glycosyltransferase family 4 protein [Planctomycetes bacterium]|nr:glycosyltransferase family 4 protein [Planctomycetota bacterium]